MCPHYNPFSHRIIHRIYLYTTSISIMVSPVVKSLPTLGDAPTCVADVHMHTCDSLRAVPVTVDNAAPPTYDLSDDLPLQQMVAKTS